MVRRYRFIHGFAVLSAARDLMILVPVGYFVTF
jgi:hypothetical protein